MSSKKPERLPILLWGDLVRGSEPVLRRALAGFRAHECMYAWVYLTEYLALQRLLEVLPGLNSDVRASLFELFSDRLWSQVDRDRIDPYRQLDRAAFETMAQIVCLATAHDQTQPLLVELGSTFFASKTKFEIVNAVARERNSDWPQIRPDWLGLEKSQFMHDVTRALHGDKEVTLLDDYAKFEGTDRFSVFYSRFVATYAFHSGVEFAGYVADRFSVAIVEDAHSTTNRDVAVANHGQPETFFSLTDVFEILENRDFEIYILDTYPDYPAGAEPCHVVKYMAIRKGLITQKYVEMLRRLGFEFDAATRKAGSAEILKRLNDGVSRRRWRQVKRAKRVSPVWGRSGEAALRERLGQIWQATRRMWPPKSGWRRHRLGGSLAVSEIERALREEEN